MSRHGDYLAPTGSGTDYVTSAHRAIDPLPAVESHVLEDLILQARRRDRLLDAERRIVRAQQLPAARLARAHAQARVNGVDVRNEIRLARLAIEAGRKLAHVERRLWAVERRVYPERE